MCHLQCLNKPGYLAFAFNIAPTVRHLTKIFTPTQGEFLNFFCEKAQGFDWIGGGGGGHGRCWNALMHCTGCESIASLCFLKKIPIKYRVNVSESSKI